MILHTPQSLWRLNVHNEKRANRRRIYHRWWVTVNKRCTVIDFWLKNVEFNWVIVPQPIIDFRKLHDLTLSILPKERDNIQSQTLLVWRIMPIWAVIKANGGKMEIKMRNAKSLIRLTSVFTHFSTVFHVKIYNLEIHFFASWDEMQWHAVNQKPRLKRLHTLQATVAIEGQQLELDQNRLIYNSPH